MAKIATMGTWQLTPAHLRDRITSTYKMIQSHRENLGIAILCTARPDKYCKTQLFLAEHERVFCKGSNTKVVIARVKLHPFNSQSQPLYKLGSNIFIVAKLVFVAYWNTSIT